MGNLTTNDIQQPAASVPQQVAVQDFSKTLAIQDVATGIDSAVSASSTINLMNQRNFVQENTKASEQAVIDQAQAERDLIKAATDKHETEDIRKELVGAANAKLTASKTTQRAIETRLRSDTKRRIADRPDLAPKLRQQASLFGIGSGLGLGLGLGTGRSTKKTPQQNFIDDVQDKQLLLPAGSNSFTDAMNVLQGVQKQEMAKADFDAALRQGKMDEHTFTAKINKIRGNSFNQDSYEELNALRLSEGGLTTINGKLAVSGIHRRHAAEIDAAVAEQAKQGSIIPDTAVAAMHKRNTDSKEYWDSIVTDGSVEAVMANDLKIQKLTHEYWYMGDSSRAEHVLAIELANKRGGKVLAEAMEKVYLTKMVMGGGVMSEKALRLGAGMGAKGVQSVVAQQWVKNNMGDKATGAKRQVDAMWGSLADAYQNNGKSTIKVEGPEAVFWDSHAISALTYIPAGAPLVLRPTQEQWGPRGATEENRFRTDLVDKQEMLQRQHALSYLGEKGFEGFQILSDPDMPGLTRDEVNTTVEYANGVWQSSVVEMINSGKVPVFNEETQLFEIDGQTGAGIATNLKEWGQKVLGAPGRAAESAAQLVGQGGGRQRKASLGAFNAVAHLNSMLKYNKRYQVLGQPNAELAKNLIKSVTNKQQQSEVKELTRQIDYFSNPSKLTVKALGQENIDKELAQLTGRRKSLMSVITGTPAEITAGGVQALADFFEPLLPEAEPKTEVLPEVGIDSLQPVTEAEPESLEELQKINSLKADMAAGKTVTEQQAQERSDLNKAVARDKAITPVVRKNKKTPTQNVFNSLRGSEGAEGDTTGAAETGKLGLTTALYTKLKKKHGEDLTEQKAVKIHLDDLMGKWKEKPGFDNISESLQEVLLDASYNLGSGIMTGTALATALAADPDTTSEADIAINLLDTATIGRQSSKGLAKRRAERYNKVATNDIETIRQDGDGTITYIDKQGETVFAFTPSKGKHASSQAGTITIKQQGPVEEAPAPTVAPLKPGLVEDSDGNRFILGTDGSMTPFEGGRIG